MKRASTWIAVVALGLFACGMSLAVEPGASTGSGDDQTEIYRLFLDGWTGAKKEPINVSLTAEAPTPEEISNFTGCAGGGVQWSAPERFADLGGRIGNLPYVRLIARETWKPEDPGDAIAEGRSVEAAVDSGFSHGLMTLSTIVFDNTHRNAALTYSFVCGRLCGSGGTVLFTKTEHGWARSKKTCGTWIS